MRRIVIWAVLGALVSIALTWPGSLPHDSATQLRQAAQGNISDWHPPAMTRLWALMGLSIPAMLALQFALLWSGIALLADQRRRAGKAPWPLFLVGLVPLLAPETGAVLKDHLLASAMLCAFGALARFGALGAALPAILGTLSRANGVFAVAPMITRNLPLALLVAAALVPATIGVNYVLADRQSGVIRSLFWFDIAGVHHYAGTGDPIADCYTPLMWDRLRTCTNEKPGPERWVATIAEHPVAYAEHRIRHFNLSTRFLVPDDLFCREWASLEDCGERGRDPLPLMWPFLWLAIGLAYLAGRPPPLAMSLAMSGVLYGLAYAVVGVASEVRYYHWTTVALCAALALSPPRDWKPLWVAASLAIAAGTAARLLM